MIDNSEGHYVLHEDFKIVRDALAKLVGVDGEPALLEMQLVITRMGSLRPGEDTGMIIEACKALLNTLP
jgi:hypothetical protein